MKKLAEKRLAIAEKLFVYCRNHGVVPMAIGSKGDDMKEIIFVVEEAAEGGFIAKAVGTSIVTEADTIPHLHQQVRDAVRCHFEPSELPKMIHLHFVREETIAA